MIPYLSGSIQPLEASNLRGAFFGIGLENTKADFVRSIMEGVGFMLRENLELLERIMGQKAEEVISLGGGAKGGCWCQIKADISNVPIRSRRQPETTSLGAAVLCAVGLGDYKTVEDALPAIEKEEKIYEPEALTRKCYDKGYERYLEYLSRACGADDQEDGSNGIK